MSSTSNVQDLLVNVFRPTYRYETGTGFVPSLVLSNVSEIITGKLQAGALVVSDSNLNTYIGSNAGTTDITRATRSNVAIGYAAMGGAYQSSNNASIGFSNFNGLSNANSNVGIGAATLMGRGVKNVLIGPNIVLGDGSGNIVIGSDISLGSVNNRFQLGRLLYGDLSAGKLGVNTTDPQAAFDISGITVFRNKVGFQNPNPDYSLDVNGSVYVSERLLVGSGTASAPIYTFRDVSGSGLYQATDASYGTGAVGITINKSPRVIVTSNKTYIYGNLDVCGTFSAASGGGGGGGGTIASNGTAGAPSFTFSNDLSTGLHLVQTSTLAFDTSGVQRMCISGGFVGIGTGAPTVALAVVGDVSATTYNGPGGTAAAPHYTFSDDRTTGLFFPGANIVGLTAGGTERMRISNANIGIGTTAPTNALDVSGTLRVIGTAGDITFTNGAIAIAGNTVVSSTGVLSNGATTSNSIGGVVLSNTDLCMNSAGRILAPILRNALAPTQFDISQGNISNSGTHTSSNFIGTASASNSIGGITLSNSYLRVADGGQATPTISFGLETNTGFFRYGSGFLGATAGGTMTMQMGSAQTYFYNGGALAATLVANQIQAENGSAGTPSFGFRGATDTGFYYIGTNAVGYATGGALRTQFSNGSISNSGTHTSSNFIGTASASNSIGGVTLSNTDLCMNSAGRILAPILRNALAPTQFDISQGNISNSGTHTSSNFIGTASASNSIGGTTLRNRQINTSQSTGAPTGFMVAGGGDSTNNTLAYSTDYGVTWTGLGTTLFSTTGYCIAWNGTRWVAGGAGTNTLAYSSDGINWTGLGTSIFSGGCRGIAWSGTRFVAVGNGTNTIAYSTDGITWTGLGSSYMFSTGGNHVAYGGSYFVAVGDGATNTLAYSSDGITWTGKGKVFSTYGTGVAYNGTLWVATGVGLSDTIYTATDPTGTWTARTITNGTYGWSVAWNGTTWLLGAQGTSNIFSSTNGTSWTGQANTNNLGTVFGLSWNGTYWVAGGAGTKRLAYSSDGATWTSAATSSFFTNVGWWSTTQNYILPVTTGTIDTTVVLFDASGGNLQIAGQAYKSGGGSWTATSDRRLKNDIQLADTSLCYSVVKSLPLKRFSWNTNYLPDLKDKRVVGWIAQDVEAVFPRAVETRPDYGIEDLRYLDVDQIYKTMYGALEKVIADKETLEAKFTKALARIAVLETALDISYTEPAVDVSGEVVDVSGTVVDVSGEAVAVTGTLVDVSGEIMYVYAASQQSSESTQTTLPTPPPPSESAP